MIVVIRVRQHKLVEIIDDYRPYQSNVRTACGIRSGGWVYDSSDVARHPLCKRCFEEARS